MSRISKFDYYSAVNKRYTEHIIELLKEPFYVHFKENCESLRKKNKNNESKTIKEFQSEMKNIKRWENDQLRNAAKFVVHKSGSNYIPKIIKAILISGSKLLTASSSRKKRNIEMNIPEPIEFLHKCFIEIGRSFYMEPYLICDKGAKPGVRISRLNDSMKLIEKDIKKSINYFLPYDNILDIYLANAEDDDTSEEEEPKRGGHKTNDDSDVESESESESESYASLSEDSDNDNKDTLKENEVEEITENINVIEEIKENDIIQDNTIGDDLPDEINFLPTRSNNNSDNESETKPDEKQNNPEIKKIKISESHFKDDGIDFIHAFKN
jgi:hypothetical protein